MGGEAPDEEAEFEEDEDLLLELCRDPAFALLPECLEVSEDRYTSPGCSLADGGDERGPLSLLLGMVCVGLVAGRRGWRE